MTRASSLTTKPTCSTAATSSTPVTGSPYSSSCSGAVDSNYAFTYTAGSVTVGPAPLTVTASSTSMTYGGTVPAITAAYSGFVNGDSSSSLTTKPTCSTTANSSSPVSMVGYASSCGGAVDPNYTISYFGGSVTVNTATLTVTASSPTMTYGGTVPTITPIYAGFVNGDTSSSLTTQPTCSTTATSSSPVSGSPYSSSCSGAADPDYTVVPVNGSVTVAKAPLTITASSGAMSYGGTAPTITPGYSGFVNGDTVSSLSTPATCSTAANSSSSVAGSPYVSACSGAVDSNYSFTYVAGSVTVTTVPLTITASSPTTTYGAAPTITAGLRGLRERGHAVLAHDEAGVREHGHRLQSGLGRPLHLLMQWGRRSQLRHQVRRGFGDGRPRHAHGDGIERIHDLRLRATGGDAALLGLRERGHRIVTHEPAHLHDRGDQLETGRGLALPVLVLGRGRPELRDRLRGRRHDGPARATLTITAQSASMTYGGPVPTISALYAGFVDGDDAASLTTAPTCTTNATTSSPVSGNPYFSSCSGAVDPNYGMTYVSGTVTIGPGQTLSIVASSGSMTYGATPPAITPAYSGFIPGDTPSSLTVKPTCSTTATSSTAVSGSPYVSSCSGAVDPNYTIVYVNGSVTVGQAPLTITAGSPTMTYGSPVPAITPVYAGFENGDTASSLTPPPTCSTEATSFSPPSPPPTYSSSCSGAVDPNYTITYVGGFTTVTPAPIAVAVRGSQANQGTPSFTGSDTPPAEVSVDTSHVTCTEVTPSTTISGQLPSGSYTLVAASCSGATLGGANAPDYALTYTATSNDFTVTGGPVPTPPPPAPTPATDGYWLVGSDGGIFTFGSAQFHGSTGGLILQRPVVGISPTADRGGYWLVASDGGIFAFGDAGFYGSIPGTGLSPAGSGLPHSLNAPIVGMVPSADGGGYFMVASDGGVFAFGDARFAGSCPGIGGCSGTAVAVVPDADGNGYWLVTQSGNVYAFGNAPFYGAPGAQGSPVTSAVRTADGLGYWVLLADGAVYAYGDAVGRGGPVGAVGGFDPASAIFADADSGGYWVASAQGAVFTYGDAPNDGSMAGTHLNGSIIAATGF